MYPDPSSLPDLTPSVAASFTAGKPSDVVRPARGTHKRSPMMVKSDANVPPPCWIECGDCEVPDPRARPEPSLPVCLLRRHPLLYCVWLLDHYTGD